MTRRTRFLIPIVFLVALGAASPASALAPGRTVSRAHAAPVTRHSLDSVLVPALRGNRAGRLRHGKLPHPGAGFTELFTQGGAKPAFGNLTRDRVRDAAAVLLSSSGAGGSDQYIALYTNGNKRRLGFYDPASAAYALDSEINHAYITRLRILHRRTYVSFRTDTYCGRGGLSWHATLRWNGRRVVSKLTPVGEPQPAC